MANYDALAEANDDAEFLKPIITKMAADLPILTTNLWMSDDKKDTDRKINAALRKELKPKAIQQATEDVQDAMDLEDETDRNRLMSEVQKLIDNNSTKQIAQMKKLMRKNFSGEDEAKNQPSRPGKSGQSSNQKSSASKSKQSGKKTKSTQKKDQNAKSSKQKRNDAANPPANSTNPSKKQRKNQGSAGGSSRGGKQKSAGRR